MTFTDEDHIRLCLRFNEKHGTSHWFTRWRYQRTFSKLSDWLWGQADLDWQEKNILDVRLRQIFWIGFLEGDSPSTIEKEVKRDIWFWGTDTGRRPYLP